MSAAIAALASYGGSDSDSDSGPDAEGGAGHSAQVAAGDAVLHLASAPPAQQALLPAVDSAPAVAVKDMGCACSHNTPPQQEYLPSLPPPAVSRRKEIQSCYWFPS
ncbi:UNVERIFIED_CONTAM: hypothetical protein K2H54_069583 [Gekko kuhli]